MTDKPARTPTSFARRGAGNARMPDSTIRLVISPLHPLKIVTEKRGELRSQPETVIFFEAKKVAMNDDIREAIE